MPRPFLNTLADVRAGGAVDDLDASLADVVQAVRNTGKTGELTLKLTIKPASKGDVFFVAEFPRYAPRQSFGVFCGKPPSKSACRGAPFQE